MPKAVWPVVIDEHRFLSLARRFMRLPTAPYFEQFVVWEIGAFARDQVGVQIRQDAYGNLLLTYDGRPSKGKGSRRRLLVATAHMDHPGLAFLEPVEEGLFAFEILGGVSAEFLPKAKVSVFSIRRGPTQRPIRGIIRELRAGKENQPPTVRVSINPHQAKQLGTDCFGMWSLTPFSISGRRLRGRACDDLAGVVVGLAFLGEVADRASPVGVSLLLTRAEEIGFGGMAAATRGNLVDPGAVYVNIECSSTVAGASLGGGPVVRVGDRRTIFDPGVTAGMVAIGEEIAAKDGSFKFQRKLMDGGVCEATALAQAGLRTGAVALPLGNYHNAGPERLSTEVVHLDDALNLVRFLVEAATTSGGIEVAQQEAKTSLENALDQRFVRCRERLLQTAGVA